MKSDNLKLLRVRRAYEGITLKDVSEGTGINISLLSRYENGITNPGLRNYMKIDEFLKSKGV